MAYQNLLINMLMVFCVGIVFCFIMPRRFSTRVTFISVIVVNIIITIAYFAVHTIIEDESGLSVLLFIVIPNAIACYLISKYRDARFFSLFILITLICEGILILVYSFADAAEMLPLEQVLFAIVLFTLICSCGIALRKSINAMLSEQTTNWLITLGLGVGFIVIHLTFLAYSKSSVHAIFSSPILIIVFEVMTLIYASVFFVLYHLHSILMLKKKNTELEAELKKKDEQIEKEHLAVLVTQIEPHFLYNALNSIRALLRTDANAAYEMLYDFSKHLRMNIDNINAEENIPFNRELEHVEAYLNVERRRFSDRLTVLMDIKVRDFVLPPLTIQTLAENAVKHGVCKKMEGGTIKISTWEKDGICFVEVSDDGVGFDTEEVISNGHFGLKYVRYRANALRNAKFEINSICGIGTIAVLQFPRQN